MLDAGSLGLSWLAGTALLGALLGVVVTSFTRGSGRANAGQEEHERRVRALEADLRVAQRSIDDLRRERDSLAETAKVATAEVAALREASGKREERIRRLKAELQHECAKTSRLRQELADRAEEMVRTSVHLREAETELGVARVGSDVILEQIARLEQERSDLNALVESLRREMLLHTEATGSQPVPRPPGRDQLADG